MVSLEGGCFAPGLVVPPSYSVVLPVCMVPSGLLDSVAWGLDVPFRLMGCLVCVIPFRLSICLAVVCVIPSRLWGCVASGLNIPSRLMGFLAGVCDSFQVDGLCCMGLDTYHFLVLGWPCLCVCV